MIITSTIIAIPKLWKKTLDRTIRKLSMGWRRTIFQQFISPTVKATITNAMATPSNIRFLLPNLGKTPFGSFILSVVICYHQMDNAIQALHFYRYLTY